MKVIKRAKPLISINNGLSDEQRIQKLSQSITGFDIDPLAVMLSKISWILAARDWLEPFNGSVRVSIPVYHADSLFAATPLSTALDDEENQDFYKLQIAEFSLDLPNFLLTPTYQPLFDAILDRGYGTVKAAESDPSISITEKIISETINDTLSDSGCTISSSQVKYLTIFVKELIRVIDTLNRDGRNGIWVFIIRNTYRPGLVAGKFNGLVSNPPWLALSKNSRQSI